MKRILITQLLLSICFILCLNNAVISKAINDPQITNPVLLPSGKSIVFSGEGYRGIFVLSTESGKMQMISDKPDAGYQANCDQKGKRIAFKLIAKDGKQQPVYYDVERQKIITLADESTVAGVPTFSKNGKIAFTVGHLLYVLNKDLTQSHRYDLGDYSNLTPISSDGSMVAYNDMEDQLWVLSLQSGLKNRLTFEKGGFYAPCWSPDSKKIAAMSLTGDVHVFEIETGEDFNLGQGESISWHEDSQHVIFCQQVRDNREKIIESQPVLVDYKNGVTQQLVKSDKIIRHLTYSREEKKIVAALNGSLIMKTLILDKSGLHLGDHKEIKLDVPKLHNSFSENNQLIDSIPELSALDAFEAPYLHQVYDTPNWFNGHWACGATSAAMALAYYDILPIWTCNCSSPYSHVSKYGRYICEIYEFNGYTFDVGGLDPNGTVGYGGYGFIIQDNWADTKGNMAKYVKRHGLGSSVDWYPNFSKLIREVDNEFPVVILNSLTGAGHYVLGIGYYKLQRGVVVNDPYGNKNRGYMNYEGERVVYDWPGYNNGRANLNTVHCLIYMRNACDLVMSQFTLAETLTVAEELPLELKIKNRGSKTSDSTEVSLYLSANSYFNENDEMLEIVPVPEIVVGDSALISVNVQLPDSLPSTKWALGAWIDEHDKLIENSESNNLYYEVFVLKGYPLLFGFSPFPGATTLQSKPEIIARFKDDYFGIVGDSTSLWVDGKEVTAMCDIQTNKISYTPEDELSPGRHTAEVTVLNHAGFTGRKKWQFQVQPTRVVQNNGNIDESMYHLSQNYPNPFNSSTKITYQLAKPGYVEISVYSIQGRLIKHLVNDYVEAGVHSCCWNGLNESHQPVASGLYFYKIQSQHYQKMKRMIYLR